MAERVEARAVSSTERTTGLDVAGLIVPAGCVIAFIYAPLWVLALLPVAALSIALERALPMHRTQRVLRTGWRTDVYHAILTKAVTVVVGGAIAAAIAMGADRVLHPLLVPVRALPVPLICVIGITLSDLGAYAEHRAAHHFRWMWQFHKVHHLGDDLDWLSRYRIHPVDSVILQVVELLPLFLLGVPAVVISVFWTFIYIDGTFAHANTRVKTGPLRWLIKTPEFHRWHHANQKAAYNRNFCEVLPLWDVLFRTVYMPEGEQPASYGVGSNQPVDYIDQLTDPFIAVWKRRPA